MSLGAVVVMATGHPKTVPASQPSRTPQATPTVLEASMTPSPSATPSGTPLSVKKLIPTSTPMPPSGTVFSASYSCDQYPLDQRGTDDYIRSCNSQQNDQPVIHEQSPSSPSVSPEPTPPVTGPILYIDDTIPTTSVTVLPPKMPTGISVGANVR